MNKTELVADIAGKTGATKKDAEIIANCLFESIIEALKKGDKVQIAGFGTFEVRDRAERTGRNPLTGDAITIKASKAASFKAGQAFKNALN